MPWGEQIRSLVAEQEARAKRWEEHAGRLQAERNRLLLRVAERDRLLTRAAELMTSCERLTYGPTPIPNLRAAIEEWLRDNGEPDADGLPEGAPAIEPWQRPTSADIAEAAVALACGVAPDDL